MKNLKKVWANLEHETRMFVIFEVVFTAMFLLSAFSEEFSLNIFVNYLLWVVIILPTLYSAKFFDVWKDPFLKISLSIKASKDEKES